jgi:hypothetical protein
MSNKLFDKKEVRITISNKKGIKVSQEVPVHWVLNTLLSYAVLLAKKMEIKGDSLLTMVQNFCAEVDPETIFPGREDLMPELNEIVAEEMAQPTANEHWQEDIAEAKENIKKHIEERDKDNE